MSGGRPFLSTACGLGAILLWSTTFAIARSLSEQVGPVTAGAAVYLIGGLLCAFRLFAAGNPLARLRSLPRSVVFGCGSLFVFYPVAIYLAVGLARDRAQLLEIALVNYLWPALTILFSLPILKQRASFWLIPGSALSLTGVLFVMTPKAQLSWDSFCQHLQTNPAPYTLALAAAVAWGLYSNLARRWSNPESGGAVEFFIPATGLALLALRLLVRESGNWTPRALGEAAVLAGITAISYVLWEVAMRKGNLLLVVASSYFTPLLSTLVSVLYLKVSPGPRLWIGSFLLVLGSLLSWRSVSERTTAAPETTPKPSSR